jgi:hypothetical protein
VITTLAVCTVGLSKYHKLVYVSLEPVVDVASPTKVKGVPPNVTPVTVSPEKGVVCRKLAATTNIVLFPT